MSSYFAPSSIKYPNVLHGKDLMIGPGSKIGYPILSRFEEKLKNPAFEIYGSTTLLGDNVEISGDVTVYEGANIGSRTKIFHYSVIRENAKVGEDCIISKGVYVDRNVIIGNRIKIENNANIYLGVTLEDEVMVGPDVTFTNDKMPRATNIEGKLKQSSDWKLSKTLVKKGASIGAGSVVLSDIVIGEYALIGAGSVVTKDVQPYTKVYGNPATGHGLVCICGEDLPEKFAGESVILRCDSCKTLIDLNF